MFRTHTERLRFMASQQPRNDADWPKVVLRRADQAVAAAVTAISLLAIGGWCLWQGQLHWRLIDIEQAEPVAIDFKIDVNEAEWTELSLLPDIGPQLAKRIVADRDAKGPFRKVSDLRRVRGIGPKTLEGMRPFLLPIADVEATAEQKTGPPQPAAEN